MSEEKKEGVVKEEADKVSNDAPKKPKTVLKEIGGPAGPEPTRFGDWEKNGRCSDF